MTAFNPNKVHVRNLEKKLCEKEMNGIAKLQ